MDNYAASYYTHTGLDLQAIWAMAPGPESQGAILTIEKQIHMDKHLKKHKQMKWTVLNYIWFLC